MIRTPQGINTIDRDEICWLLIVCLLLRKRLHLLCKTACLLNKKGLNGESISSVESILEDITTKSPASCRLNGDLSREQPIRQPPTSTSNPVLIALMTQHQPYNQSPTFPGSRLHTHTKFRILIPDDFLSFLSFRPEFCTPPTKLSVSHAFQWLILRFKRRRTLTSPIIPFRRAFLHS